MLFKGYGYAMMDIVSTVLLTIVVLNFLNTSIKKSYLNKNCGVLLPILNWWLPVPADAK